jgi:hypothetical protein
MAKTFTAPFTQSKNIGTAVVTLATTDYAAGTNAVLLFTAGAEGALLRRVTAMPRATVTASKLVLFRSADAGVTKILAGSALMAAHTVAATTATPITDLGIPLDEPWSLEPGEEIYCASAVALAGGITFVAEGENF